MAFWRRAESESAPRQSFEEIFVLARRYLVQETIGPLRRIGRVLAFGLAGALAYGIGSVIVLVGLLRLLESETGGTFGGNWAFAPYLFTALAGAAFVGVSLLVARRAIQSPGRRSSSPPARMEGS